MYELDRVARLYVKKAVEMRELGLFESQKFYERAADAVIALLPEGVPEGEVLDGI